MENICVPVTLDAFVLTPALWNGTEADHPSRIAPITQPNYTGLRLDSALIQHDTLNHVDLHRTKPASLNSRVADLGSPSRALKDNRFGVYLHWVLPRTFRSGRTAAANGTNTQASSAVPIYSPIPNRWLIVRRLRASDPPTSGIADFQGWIVESDRVSRIDDIDPKADLEVEVSPFVQSGGDPSLPGQAKIQSEVFLGGKFHAELWGEDGRPERVKPLTVNSSSNPFFADYTVMNSNVLSILDNFSYGDPLKPSYLKSATADYCVIGWHSDEKDDPFTDDSRPLKDRLSDFFMTVTNPNDSRLKLPDSTRSIYSGSMYTVVFDRLNPPKTVLADEIGKNFRKEVKMEPVSVGATALDAVLAYLRAHETDDLSKDIVKIASLLIAADETYDTQVQAQDLLYGYNYDASDGGIEWHYDGTVPRGAAPNTPATPSPTEADALMALNEAQTRLDILSNDIRDKRYQMFSLWWQLVSDRQNSVLNHNNDPVAIQKRYRQAADDLSKVISDLFNQQTHLQGAVLDHSKKVRCKKVSKLPFFQRKDPTVSIAGMGSGWPDKWLQSLLVRFEDETPKSSNASQVAKLPPGLQPIASRVFNEFLGGPPTAPPPNSPLANSIPWWKSWNNTQPFFPLFVEWEAAYFQIPKELWKVESYNSGDPPHVTIRYAVDEPLAGGKYLEDVRTVSGRVLILPQAALSLQNLVANLVATFPAKNGPITDEERTTLLDPTLWANFKYLSLTLSGFTDHLITRIQGSHVKPNARKTDGTLQVLKDAIDASSYGFTNPVFPLEYLKAIEAESSVTPYGNAVEFDDDTVFPFKAVTAGQACFTKLNIIDKFGQAIPALEPKPIPKDQAMPLPSLYPCMSDYLTPNSIGGFPNVVFRDKDTTLPSRFIQLTPSINQNARINAHFVKQVFEKNAQGVEDPTKFRYWTPCNDWDQPIWGWIVVNYADYGLQFFLADGTFYTEVRIGGPRGTSSQGQKWLPFGVPSTTVGHPQLDGLIARLTSGTSPEYLYAFAAMINESIKSMPHAPDEYAGYMSSIVGKPLALVNTSWSLELSQNPVLPGNTLGNKTPKPGEELTNWPFSIKLGDWSRPFDGMVAYFDMTTSNSSNIINYDRINTYFATPTVPPNTTNDPRHFIDETLPYPTLAPYFAAADASSDPFSPTNPTPTLETAARQGFVKAMLIDPFTPVHAYSPTLPVKSLQLPGWTIQSALQNMTAFFHLGPISVTEDIPIKYDSSMEPKATVNQAPFPPGTHTVNLPMSSSTKWRWFQPYALPVDNTSQDDGSGLQTKYNALPIGTDDGSPKFSPGPYTMLEGYLQLLEPAVKPVI